MTSRERHLRRATIVRRAAAAKVSRAQREIWAQRRRARGGEALVDDGTEQSGVIDELEQLPDCL